MKSIRSVVPSSFLMRSDAAITVYYDGACPICSREIALYRRQSGAEQCGWVDAASCPEVELGKGLSRARALARFHVRRADGELVDGIRGFAALWRTLPRFAWAGRIASIWPLSLLLDAAYRVVLWMRPIWHGLRMAPTSNNPAMTCDPAPSALHASHVGLTGAACAGSRHMAVGSSNKSGAALQRAKLVNTLKGNGPFTVLAPTDETFAELPKADVDALLKDKAKLNAVLMRHLLTGKVLAKDSKAGKLKAVQDIELTVATTGDVTVDAAKVPSADGVADNGVIHLIDTALIPK